MREDVRVEHGGISTILGLEIDGIQLVANLPDHLDSVTVRRALLEGADRLAEAAIADPSINATDDVRDRAHVDETPEEPTAIADGGERFVACPESVLEELVDTAKGDLERLATNYNQENEAIAETIDELAEAVEKAEAILEADARIAASIMHPYQGAEDWDPFDEWDLDEEIDAEAIVDELEDEPINQAGEGIQEEP